MPITRIIILLCILLIPTASYALRCGSDLISTGDRKLEVLHHCGEPVLKESWEEETVTHVTHAGGNIVGDLIINRDASIGNSRLILVEEWTYNFGSNRFLQFLTFKNGKLYSIEDGSKGFYGDILSGYNKSKCGYRVDRGDKKIDIIRKCGDPYSIEYSWEERVSSVSSTGQTRRIPRFYKDKRGNRRRDFRVVRERVHSQTRVIVNIEEWVYNFGPTQFLYFITLENGEVVKVEDGDYGF